MKRANPSSHRRRGAAAAFVAISMVMILSFAALAIDVGHITATRAELQHSADAAALAAASQLGAAQSMSPMALALESAKQYARTNSVVNQAPYLEDADVVYGQAVLDGDRYRFVPGGAWTDAVRVTVRRTKGSQNGALPLFFAPIMGFHHTDVAASAAAMLTPRDIVVVADLSTSHTDDSELKNIGNIEVNLWDVWEGLAPAGGAVPMPSDASDETYEQFAGPLWGNMKSLGWGTTSLNSSYFPSQDSGLAYLPRNSNWNHNALRQALTTQGYSSDEVSAIFSSEGDGSAERWVNRVGVALGLATWSSGIGGRGNGDGDNRVESNEVSWTQYPHESGSWSDWIGDYVGNKSIATINGENFKYRFGAKTFVNYLVESKPGRGATNALAGAPVQPMQAVKDAVTLLADELGNLDGLDRVSLVVYDDAARVEVSLTDEYDRVSDRLNEMQAGYYGQYTNMGDGIRKATQVLTGPDSRDSAKKYMFVLTDGLANVNQNGGKGDYDGGRDFARSMAKAAASQNIQIFTVTVGTGADRSLMEELASTGGGMTFHAEGSIEEYSAELEAIFARLASTRPVVMIE